MTGKGREDIGDRGTAVTTDGSFLKNKGIFLLFALIIIAATSLIVWTVIKTDRQMRADMVREASFIARGANVNRVRALTGTGSDLANPSYLRLKEQFSTAKQIDSKYRLIYLMGLRPDGTVAMLVDTEEPGSSNYSPPGRVYSEAPESFRQVFATHDAMTFGPYTDGSEKWITALVPVYDPQTVANGFATPADAQSMVRRAREFLRKNGRDRFLKEVSKYLTGSSRKTICMSSSMTAA